MDDINSALQSILSDRDSMEKIREMAGSLGLGNTEQKKEKPDDLMEKLGDAQNMAKLIKVMSAVKNTEDDERTRLLLALKPHLSPERRDRVDTAVKILRLLSLAPILKESGILL